MSDADCITTIRGLAIDAVQKANSGHPGAPVGMAPVAHALWGDLINFEWNWPARDRFVLSNGHACALIYTLLHLYGVLPKEELINFRQLGSLTPGHPERGHTPGIEVTTGPLGQGIANAVGLAIAQEHLNSRFPGLFDHKTYVFTGDGCLQEGVGCEAISLAGTLGLKNLIAVYDNNFITIDGPTSLSYNEDVPQKFRALGWNVIEVKNGDSSDLTAIRGAFAVAHGEPDRPTIIILHTTIGFGTAKAGSESVHGSPLGEGNVKAWKLANGRNPDETFVIPEDVAAVYSAAAERGKVAAAEWRTRAEAMAADDKTGFLRGILDGNAIAGLDGGADALDLPYFDADAKLATRQTSQKILAALAKQVPGLIGGSADLTGSNLTLPAGVDFSDFSGKNPAGRYIRYGVREHAMFATANGLAAYGGMVPYVGTFLNFAQYCLPAIRLAALSRLRVLFVATHDSIGLGEDGPTHQPTEAIAQLRATPNLRVFRPADGNENSACYRAALAFSHGPSVLCLTRQGVPTVTTPDVAEAGVKAGAYVLRPAAGGQKPSVILVSSGSEVSVCLAAAEAAGDDVAVVSAPCVEAFLEGDEDAIENVFPSGVPVIAVEPYVAFGWQRIAHYTITLDGYGASAPAPKLFEHFGFTKDAIASKIALVKTAHATTPAPLRVKRLW